MMQSFEAYRSIQIQLPRHPDTVRSDKGKHTGPGLSLAGVNQIAPDIRLQDVPTPGMIASSGDILFEPSMSEAEREERGVAS